MGRLAVLLNALGPSRRAAPAGTLIAVTGADIEETIREGGGVREGRSPLARAIGRELGAVNVNVSSDAVTIVWSMTPPDVEVVPLPGVARRFNRCFARGRQVEPFTFTLTGITGPQALTGFPAAIALHERERAIVRRIRDKSRALLGRADDFSPGSRDLYIVKRVLAAYLPETIATYSDLPIAWSHRALGPDGRTGIQILHDELALIEAELDAIADRLEHAKADQLLANERFLESQFEREPDEPEVPPQVR